MNRDDIIRMAREVWGYSDVMTNDLANAYDMGVANEREACAVIAETPISGEQDDITMQAKDRVATAIRAREQL